MEQSGVDASLLARLKELEENRRLKKMYAEEGLKVEIISEDLQKSCKAVSKTRDSKEFCCEMRANYLKFLCNSDVGERCYQYCPKLSAENKQIAVWLIRVMTNCFVSDRNLLG